MEYLVTMTTRVPAGTSELVVDEVRAREVQRAAELAGSGYLLRLWRPPLRSGEWRSLGLFSAPDEVQLEQVLASMPLRIWRSDAVLPLSPHPNDPASMGAGSTQRVGSEFLITMTVVVPHETSQQRLQEVLALEAERARELATQGHLRRLWLLPAEPGRQRALGLWHAGNGNEITAIVDALPLRPWMEVEITPLTPHPSDPAGH